MPTGVYERKIKYWNEPAFKNRFSQLSKARWANPEYKKKWKDSRKGHIVTEETRRKIGETLKKNYKKENHPMLNKKHNEKSKEKMSLSHRKEKSWCWKGGVTQNYYKRLFGYMKIEMICSECGSKEYIVIHHKNRNRRDNSLENLNLLCRSCHAVEHDLIKSSGMFLVFHRINKLKEIEN